MIEITTLARKARKADKQIETLKARITALEKAILAAIDTTSDPATQEMLEDALYGQTPSGEITAHKD